MRERFTTPWRGGIGEETSFWMTRTGNALWRPWRRWWDRADGMSLQATFRRGWYFGSEAFREKLLKALGREAGGLADKRRSGYTGAQTRDHGVTEAERKVRSHFNSNNFARPWV